MAYIDNNKEKIYYKYIKAIDKDNAEFVVLIHGLGLDLSSWDGIIPYLKDFHILLYDVRGHGLSSNSIQERITWELLCKDLEYLIKQHNIQRFHLIGYGLGGNIGVKFALYLPDQLLSLTLISTTCYYPLEISEKVAEGRRQLIQHGSMQALATYLAHQIYFKPSELRISQLLKSFSKVSVKTYFDLADLIIHTVSLDELVHISSIPTLVLTGEYDQIYSPHLFGITSSYIPKSRFLIVPNASNAVHLDQPELVTSWFKDFIDNYLTGGKKNTSLMEQSIHIREMISKGKVRNDSLDKLKVDVMGTFKVQINGEEIVEGWNQRKAKQLLSFLVYYQTTTREQLYDVFWSEIDLKKAQNYLRVSLNHLKNLLNKEVDGYNHGFLKIDRQHVSLQGEIQCDLLDFLHLINRANNELNTEIKAILYRDILEKVPRSLFPGLYDQWILEIRDKIEEDMVDIAKWISYYLSEKNLYGEAIKYIEIALRYNPMDEYLYEQIVMLYKKVKRYQDAVTLEEKKREMFI